MDIICLQETHLSPTTQSRFAHSWGTHRYCSSFSMYTRMTYPCWQSLYANLPILPPQHVLADQEGRYIVIMGLFDSTPLTLITSYTPNVDTPEFFRHIMRQMEALPTGTLAWGGDGDHNLVLNPAIDCTQGLDRWSSIASAALQELMDDNGLVDIWRVSGPTSAEYTFHSPVHNSSSRLDFWLGSQDVVGWGAAITHLPRSFSDHPLSYYGCTFHRPAVLCSLGDCNQPNFWAQCSVRRLGKPP